MITKRFALRATPPDPGALSWLDRERELVEDALDSAHGMQGAPDWYSFTEILIERIERSYQLEKEELVRWTWQEERSLTVDEFEWGIYETIRRDDVEGELTCDICENRRWEVEVHNSGRWICDWCWERNELDEQRLIGEFA